MDKKEFGELIRQKVKDGFGDKMEVTIREVRKNNGVVKLGLMVNDKCRNVAPTIYLDDLYRDYEVGRDLDEILKILTNNLKRGMPKTKIDLEFFTEYKNVSDKICYKLVNYEKNKELLEEVPFVPFLDLAICFFYPFWHEEIGGGSILIRDSHAERWGVSVRELWRVANENTRKLYPEICCSMDGMLAEMSGMRVKQWEALPEKDWGPCGMKILSNRQKIFGAAVILYDGYLEKIAEIVGESFYVIPSSVHEVLLLPILKDGDQNGLRQIISEVNETNVEEEDVLSNNLYRFDKEKRCVEIV